MQSHKPDLSQFLTGPLHIDFVASPLGGQIGLTNCPGRNQVDSRGRVWLRNLSVDLDAVEGAGISTLITFLDQQELNRLGAGELPELVQTRPFQWFQLPIKDFGIPASETLLEWRGLLGPMLDHLRQNQRILLHCAAGLGRSGMMAATLLKAGGLTADDAMQLIRRSRPGTIETIEQENLVERANVIGKIMSDALNDMSKKYPIIGEVRGRGAMQAIELVEPGTKTPNTAAMNAIVKYCQSKGVLVLTAGTYSNVVRFLPPIVITDELLKDALSVLDEALASL